MYTVLITLILSIFNYICLEISGDFNHKEYLLLSLTPILAALPLFSFNLFLSTFMKKTKGNIGKAIQKITFYINRAGKNLANKAEVNKAKEILKKRLEKEKD